MILLGKVVLGIGGVALAAGAVLCSEGLVQVQVIEKQPQSHHIYVIAPAMLAPIAVSLAPRSDLAQAACQIQPYMPAIRAALIELRDSDDITLVEVNEPDEHLQVSKSGGAIVVDVTDARESVHVSAPIRALASTIEQLASAASNPAPPNAT
jgi:hypothetical protein